MPERLPDLVNIDAALTHCGRYVTATMLLDLGDASYLVHIQEGRIIAVEPKGRVMPVWTFALRAPREEWDQFWAPRPAPGSHDIMALMRRQVMTAEGDLHPFMANLRYFKDVLATLRRKEGTR
ncbi:hypothetical protein AB0E67_30660 [Streptomyces sp. NPDC032161]|uniref:hypothetical protein n=1 Tax=unclassified Streptomyces TaxID=2593676 RepID=UPI0033CDD255